MISWRARTNILTQLCPQLTPCIRICSVTISLMIYLKRSAWKIIPSQSPLISSARISLRVNKENPSPNIKKLINKRRLRVRLIMWWGSLSIKGATHIITTTEEGKKWRKMVRRIKKILQILHTHIYQNIQTHRFRAIPTTNKGKKSQNPTLICGKEVQKNLELI